MNSSSISYLFVLLLFILSSCTSNDAQESFERRAYNPAEGITQTDNNANIIGSADDDDWQTSPFYSGLASIEPAFPNPVLYGTTSNLDVFMNGNSLTSILELGYFDFQDRWNQISVKEDVSEFSAISFIVNTELFGSNAELARGTHRLIIFDANQRVVTYGDIQID